MGYDITIVNLNMLFIRYKEKVDRELHVPLGSLYLTSVLEEAGYHVDFRDYQTVPVEDPFNIDNLLRFMEDSAEIVGFSCMANLLPFTLLAMKAFKEKHPHKTLILGGVGPFSVEEKVLARFSWVDVVAYGEGESLIVPLLRALQDGRGLKEVPGVLFRDDRGVIVRNPPPVRIAEPDVIPFPAFHKIDIGRYEGYGVMTSRGCPFPCTFCSVAPIWGRNPTVRSNASVIEEMRLINETTGADLFLFQDEFFLCSKERAESFSRDLIKSGLNLRWKAFGRVNLTDRDSMRLMADSGCIELRFGIECGSNEMLRKVEKGFTIEEAVTVISDAVQIIDRVDSFFIWGFPFETEKDFYKTLFHMLSFRLMGSRILPSLFTFLPQTTIYNEYKDHPGWEFYPRLLPEYMLTGHETICDGYMEIDPSYDWIFNFIKQHREIFPGFFNINVEQNILPKFKVLQEHGFYAPDAPLERSGVLGDAKEADASDSCGAHSPKVGFDPRQELFTRGGGKVTHR